MIETAEAFIDDCKERQLAESTLDKHRTALNLFSDWSNEYEGDPEACTSNDLEEFIDWLKINWNEEYSELRNTVFWSLTRYFDYLVSEGQTDKNPCEDVDVAGRITKDIASKYLRRVRRLKSGTTVQNREFGLILFTFWLEQIEQAEIEEIDPIDLEDYAIYLKGKGYTDGTVIDRFSTVSTLFEFLDEKQKVLEENPASKVDLASEGIIDTYDNPSKQSKELKDDIFYIEEDEKELLLENVPSPKLRNELIIELMWQTGMRRQEVVDVEIDDIHPDENRIQVQGKNTKNRDVFYQPSLEDRLNIWLDGGLRNSSMYAEESDYLFLTDQSGQLHPQHINRIVLQAAEEAGIQEVLYTDANGNPRHKVTPHTLRHGFAVRSIKNGLNMKMLAEIMGHESLDTTKEYLKFSKEDIQQEYRKFGPGGTADS